MKRKRPLSEDAAVEPDLRFNVGGVVYPVSRRMLAAHPDTFFGAMFSRISCLRPAAQDESGAYIVERSADAFIFVLRFLSGNGDLHLQDLSEAGLEKLAIEGDFYQLRGLERKVRAELRRRKEMAERTVRSAEQPLRDQVRRLEADAVQLRQSLEATERDLDLARKKGAFVKTWSHGFGGLFDGKVGDRVRPTPGSFLERNLKSGIEGTITATGLDRSTEMAVEWDDGTCSSNVCGGKRGHHELVFV